MARRWRLARGLMDRHDLRALLLFGNSGVNRHNQANVFWLSNHLDLHHCYLLAPRDEAIEPALYTGLDNHVPDARRIAEVPVVAWGGRDPAATVAGRLRATGITRGRLGLVGVNATFGMGMPYQHHATLRRALPDLELVDVTADLAGLRTVKSEEEIGWLRRAAEYTDRAVEALRTGSGRASPSTPCSASSRGRTGRTGACRTSRSCAPCPWPSPTGACRRRTRPAACSVRAT
jgi:Xaa-Pro aminopeptidase